MYEDIRSRKFEVYNKLMGKKKKKKGKAGKKGKKGKKWIIIILIDYLFFKF